MVAVATAVVMLMVVIDPWSPIIVIVVRFFPIPGYGDLHGGAADGED